MRKAVIIVVSWAIAIAVFWLIFFKATPALCALVPASSWKGFADVVIYIIVACIGGIGLPIGIGSIGTALALR